MKKKLCIELLVSCLIFALTACGGSGKAGETQTDETTVAAETTENNFTWPFGAIGQMLPKFEGKPGELSWEDNTGLSMHLYDISKSDFTDYAAKCQEAGFNVDYNIRDTSYSAYNAEGYDLYLSYTESDSKLWIRVNAPEASSESETSEVESSEALETTVAVETSKSETTTEETIETNAASTVDSSDIRPEIKEAIDSYEAFFNEYCEFMKKYNGSSDQTGMLSEYTSYKTQCAETMEKLEALEDADLTDAELLYLNDAALRIYNKLTESGVM